MITSKTIVRQLANRNTAPRRSADALAHTSDHKVGERMHMEITPERICVRAYEIYQARNGAPGDAESDWHQAERELNGKTTSASAMDGAIADPAILEIKMGSDAEPICDGRTRL